MRLLTLFLLWGVFESATWATCTGSSPTWTTTPDYASVSTCVTNASRNDNISVLAGSANWGSSTLSFSKGLHLIGAGVGSTVITGGQDPIINFQPDGTAIANSETLEIAGFTFDCNNTCSLFLEIGGASSSATKAWKTLLVHHNKFQNASSSGSNGAIYTLRGQLRGLIHHNTFDRVNMVLRPIGNDDTADWTNSAFYSQWTNAPGCYGCGDNLYFEDNTIQWSSSYTGSGNTGILQTDQGMRVVVRFNTWNINNLSQVETDFQDNHGFQNYYGSSNGQSGNHVVEYYDNTLTGSSASAANPGRMFNHRGAKGMYFDNSYVGVSNMYINADQYDGGCNSQIVPSLSGILTGINDTYVWNNKSNGTLISMTTGPANACGDVENTNWWNQQTSFNGTVGMGRGPKASMPSTCTLGAGYWATDEGSWNTTLPSGTSGDFYKCTATNTWTLYYTPYQYPHPLQSVSSSSSVSPPSNLTLAIK